MPHDRLRVVRLRGVTDEIGQRVDVMLARRKMRLNTLAELVGITAQNLSVLKTGKAKAIRFSTLERLCEVLECEPGDLLAFEKGAVGEPETVVKGEIAL